MPLKNSFIHFRESAGANRLLLADFSQFLSALQDRRYKNPFTDYIFFRQDYHLFRQTARELRKKLQENQGCLSPRQLDIQTIRPGAFLLSIDFSGNLSAGSVYTFYARKSGRVYRFYSPLSYYTDQWSRSVEGNIQFIFPGQIIPGPAIFYGQLDQAAASFFQLPASETTCYYCEHPAEYYRLNGVPAPVLPREDVHFTNRAKSIIFSDLVCSESRLELVEHYSRLFTNGNSNALAVEGILEMLYQAGPAVSTEPIEIRPGFDSPVSGNQQLLMRTSYSLRVRVSHFYCQKIYGEKGLAGIYELLSAGPGVEDFVAAACRITSTPAADFYQQAVLKSFNN